LIDRPRNKAVELGYINLCITNNSCCCCCYGDVGLRFLQMPGSSAGRKCDEWTAEDMERALSAMERGDMGLNAAAKSYGVPKATLSRHQKSTNLFANGSVKFHGQSCVLSQSMEEELVMHCLQLESMYFGLRIDDLRRLAFDLAEANGVHHNFNREEKMAGKKWYYAFMQRHPELSLREPENTSLARAQGFNRPRVEAFFQLLGKVFDEEHLTPDRLYNMDETSLSTVQDGQKKIIGARGKRRIGTITSSERGESTTAVVCMSASGCFIPPFLIYKRKRMKGEIVNGAPPGTVFAAQEKGWMSHEGFCLWLRHFIDTVKPTVDRKVVLILDGHVTHVKNLEAIEMARKAGIRMISLPPHTTHRLQPLDVAFFGPLGTYYDEAGRTWMRQHPGRAVTSWQVAELFGSAYCKAASVGTAVSGFRASGLWPLDIGVFSDSDFAASAVTDICSIGQSKSGVSGPVGLAAEVTDSIQLNSTDLQVVDDDNVSQADEAAALGRGTPVDDAQFHTTRVSASVVNEPAVVDRRTPVPLVCSINQSGIADPAAPEVVFSAPLNTTDQQISEAEDGDINQAVAVSTVIPVSVADDQIGTAGVSTQPLPTMRIKTPWNNTSDAVNVVAPSDIHSVHVSDISPVPVMESQSCKRKRRASHAVDVTSTPYKTQLESTPSGKKAVAKKRLNLAEAQNNQKRGKSTTVTAAVKNRKKKTKELLQSVPEDSSTRPTKNRKTSGRKSQKKQKQMTGNSGDIWICNDCSVEYGDQNDTRLTEDWVTCETCAKCFHMSCAENCGVVDDDESFVCKDCL